MNDFSLVKAVVGFGQSVVIAVADTSDWESIAASTRHSEYLLEAYWADLNDRLAYSYPVLAAGREPLQVFATPLFSGGLCSAHVQPGPFFTDLPAPCPSMRGKLRSMVKRVVSAHHMGVVDRRGSRQNLADQFDTIRLSLIVHEANHGLNRRSISALAKYTLTFRRISFASRSSRLYLSVARLRS